MHDTLIHETEADSKSVDTSNNKICRDFMLNKCHRDSCKFKHDDSLCFHFWKFKSCKFGDTCRKHHNTTSFYYNPTKTPQTSNKLPAHKRNRPRNTECFEPMDKPVDLRIVCDLGNESLSTQISSRDVLYVPNLFSEFKHGELYDKLVKEIEKCDIPKDQLLKLWHGNDKIPGTHLIVNDRTQWKNQCPTFNFVIEHVTRFFNMKVEATRLNWYKDTSQWKPFHHDSSYVDPKKAEIQNFTVAVSFGATRDAAFEKADNKTVISFPQPDGSIYCFSKDTNIIWRHGILQDTPVRDEGRISIILWGSIDQKLI